MTKGVESEQPAAGLNLVIWRGFLSKGGGGPFGFMTDQMSRIFDNFSKFLSKSGFALIQVLGKPIFVVVQKLMVPAQHYLADINESLDHVKLGSNGLVFKWLVPRKDALKVRSDA